MYLKQEDVFNYVDFFPLWIMNVIFVYFFFFTKVLNLIIYYLMIAFLKVMHFSSLLFRTLYLMFSLFWSFTAIENYTLKTGCCCIRPSYPTKKGNTEENTSIDLDSCFEDTMLVYVILIIKTVCKISYAFLSIRFWGFM